MGISNVVVSGFGVLLMCLVLAICFSVPRPNKFQCFTLRVVLALAAAAIAASIPGFLNLQIGGVLRASGALSIFIVVYCFNPPLAVNRPTRKRGFGCHSCGGQSDLSQEKPEIE